jgi:regulator of cell morphogenesis and NO signaling
MEESKMKTFDSNQSIGEIVSIFPKASEVFKQYKIDFCCGGGRPLIEAIKEQKLDESEVLKRLEEGFEKTEEAGVNSADFRNMNQGDLIEYIETTHHAYVKKALPELGELTNKIMQVHGMKHEELFKVHKLFAALKTELEQHLIKEEQILFPLIKEYAATSSGEVLKKIKKVMKETEEEHEAAGNILKELRNITGDYKVPDGGCYTFNLTFHKLIEFEADLFQHIHLENNILFKKIVD